MGVWLVPVVELLEAALLLWMEPDEGQQQLTFDQFWGQLFQSWLILSKDLHPSVPHFLMCIMGMIALTPCACCED